MVTIRTWGLGMAMVLAVGLTAPSQAGAVPRVVAVMTSEGVRQPGTEPVGVTDTFRADAPEIHAVVILADAVPGSVLRGVWVAVDAVEEPDYEIAAVDVALKDPGTRAHFSLSRPDSGWPPGRYELRLYLDGTYILPLPFSIEPARDREAGTPAAAAAPRAEPGVVGEWTCRLEYMGRTGPPAPVRFDGRGGAVVNGRSFSYELRPGGLLVLSDGTGESVYEYAVEGDAMDLRFQDGSRFRCRRGAQGNAPAPAGPPAAGAGGQEWQLAGAFCHWSGSSGMSSGYSRTARIVFDGRGSWTFGTESSFSSDAGMAYGSGGSAGGTYTVQGDVIRYVTGSGEQGTARVHVRQASGEITELYLDGELYAKELCE